ncbi:hypothetical protein BpsS140_00050 [Bacillus phage vB_BpsS-140]|nr:hypothetical protein BpsS140_00050 [Bacillus phage vB_BpsS-140]
MSWSDIGADRNSNSGSSDIVSIETSKTLRLLLPDSGPVSHWTYALSAPDDSYRTWIAPAPEDDFFAINSRAFRPRPVHAGLCYDYEEGKILILEQGNQVWEAIANLHKAGKDLNGRDIVITKSGTGRSTEYSVVDKDPTPFPHDITSMTQPDMNARYIAPTKESLIEDLRSMGFTNPEELFVSKEINLEEAKQVKIPFGKHKDKTLNEVYLTDSQYLSFLSQKIDRNDIKQNARVVANALIGTNFEVEGMTPSVDEVAFVSQQSSQQPTTTTPPTPANVQVHDDGQGNIYHLINNEWVLQPKQPVAPPPPTPPVAPPAPPSPPAPPASPSSNETVAPPTPVGGGFDRNVLMAEINAKFEHDPKFKDFMLIIQVMKQATAPNEKTSITEFTDDELIKLKNLLG